MMAYDDGPWTVAMGRPIASHRPNRCYRACPAEIGLVLEAVFGLESLARLGEKQA